MVSNGLVVAKTFSMELWPRCLGTVTGTVWVITSDAFTASTQDVYGLRLDWSKGIFRTPCYTIHPKRHPYTDKYALWLVFEPYLPIQERRSNREFVTYSGLSRWTEFVCQRVGSWHTSPLEACTAM